MMYVCWQEFKLAVEDESGNHKVVNTSAKELTEFCKDLPIRIDTAPIENEVRDANTRYEKLKTANLDAKLVEQNVALYQSAIDPVKETLDELDAFLDSEADFGLDVEQGKAELQRVEDLIADLENQKAELDVVELGTPLEAEETEYVEQMATVSYQYDLNAGKIKRVKKNMAKRLDKFVVFMEIFDEVDIWLVEMQKIVDDFEPVSDDSEVAKTQLEELQVSALYLWKTDGLEIDLDK